jgi:hypothetical protein
MRRSDAALKSKRAGGSSGRLAAIMSGARLRAEAAVLLM